ncbi:MAG: nucleoside phosphorylase [Rhodospirillaceae bacterium]|nr:nucleoside phosphorylase [Rhodospirillaceae bacterium]
MPDPLWDWPEGQPLRIAAITGMVAEARCLPPGLPAGVSGGDPGRAEALARAAVAAGAEMLLSTGLAGGLDPALRTGDVVAGTWVTGPGDIDAPCPATVPVPGAVAAVILGVDGPAATAAQKAELYARTQAAVVDMESHRVARAAVEGDVLFAVLRVVLDPADLAIPQAALCGLGPEGRTRPGTVLRALARRPGELPALVGLAWRTRRALAVLRRCLAGAAGFGA